MRKLVQLISMGALVCLCIFFGSCCLAQANKVQDSTTSESKWHSVSLPFRPVCIAGNETVLWVCGVNEMLAKSQDGGKTWQVKHQKLDGEVLLTVGVLNEHTVYASGTNGTMLWSNDSGETWKSWTAGAERILDISFADDKHGIRHTLSGVQVTEDGGVQWSEVAIMKTEDLRDYSNIFGVAALSSSRLAILINKTQGENLFLSSQDGGATWKPLHLEDTYAHRLFVRNGEFWAFGMEILERKNRGGYGAPLVLHSADGLQWTHGAKSPWEFHSCALQGCVLYDGAIVQLYQAKPQYFAFLADKTLTSNWVMSKGNICTLASSVKCSLIKPSDDLPPRPFARGPVRASEENDLADSLPRCLVCPLAPFALSKSILKQVPMTVVQPGQEQRQMSVPGLQTDLEVRFQARKDGTVDQIQVNGQSPREIKSGVLQQVGTWVMEPASRAALPAEDTYTVKLKVFCDGFGPGDQASCLGFIPPKMTATPKD